MSNINKMLNILSEMSPRIIPPLDGDKHQKEAQNYYTQNKSKFKQTDIENLYKSGDNHNGYYMYVVNDIVEYFAKYSYINYKKLLGKMIQQVLVHRNKHSVLSAGIPKKVFFNHLIPTFGAIVTDFEQTEDGKNFWINAVGEALDNPDKFSVYIIKRSEGKKYKIETKIDFDAMTKHIWGTEKCFELILVAIVLNK